MIYTDGIHLVATTLKELHGFAEKIGLHRCYYEGYRKGHPHYDLIKPWMKKTASENGAILVTSKEIINLFNEKKIQSKYSDCIFVEK